MASFRICATEGCKARLPDAKYDSHLLCSKMMAILAFTITDVKCWPDMKFD